MRTRIALVIILLVFLVAAATSLTLMLTALGVTVREMHSRADNLAQQFFYLASRLAERSRGPFSAQVLSQDVALTSFLESSIGYSEIALYIMLVDEEGRALLHSEPEKIGQEFGPRPDLASLAQANPVRQLAALYGKARIYEAQVPLVSRGKNFGRIRVGVSTRLIREKVSGVIFLGIAITFLSAALAGLVAVKLTSYTLRPLRQIAEGLEKWRQREFAHQIDVGGQEELKDLSSNFKSLGEFLTEAQSRLSGESLKLDKVIDRLEEGVILLDKNQRVILFNRSMAAVLDTGLPQAVGRSLGELGPRLGVLNQKVTQAFSSRTSTGIAPISLPLDGGSKDFLMSIDLIEDMGQVVGGLIEMRNAAPLHDLREQLDYASRLAALTRLTAGVAHEVKNPLNSIVIHLALLQQKIGHGSPEAVSHLAVINDEIKRLDRVVNGLLEFYRPRDLHWQLVDVNSLVEEVVSLQQPQAETSGVKIFFYPRATIASVRADRDQLKQALINLLLNAWEAMPDGGQIDITTYCQGNNSVVIAIQDQGKGIDPEELAKVFHLFYTTKEKGNGLGLPVTYRIVQLHGGQIEISSQPGQGAKVILSLPCPEQPRP